MNAKLRFPLLRPSSVVCSLLLFASAAQTFAADLVARVYATREGLVGHRTANGHIIGSNDRFVALPSGSVLNSLGGYTYTVNIRNPANGRTVTGVPIWDVGPWNTHDNYWHKPRTKFDSLPLGLPEAQAAYQNNFNNGKDEFGRDVANPAGIDLAEGTWADLGMVNNGWLDVTYNWQSAPAPSAPSSLSATALSASQIKVTWKDNSYIETGFKIERATSSGGPFSQVGTVGINVTSYTSGSLSSGTKYWFRVRAYNGTGNSSFSNQASATTKDTIPAAPSALTATAVSDTQINLAWTDNSSGEDGFRIYRSTDGTTFTSIGTVGVNVRSYNSTGLTGNRKYWYKVAAFNTAGTSGFSNIASDTTAPQAPSALIVSTISGTANWNKLALSWTDNSGSEVGFKIERATASAGPFTQIATNAAGVNTYNDSGLTATTTYYYRVRSYNANGNSAYSNTASKTTPNAPPVLNPIGNKTVSAGNPLTFTASSSDPNAPAASTAYSATWEGSADGTAEVVFRKPGNSGSTTQFMDTALTNYTLVKTGGPSGVGGTKALKSQWTFKTGSANYWIRYTTASAPSVPNPTIALDQVVKFRLYTTKALKVGIGVRETGTTAAYGADGGLTGAIEWVGVTNVVSGVPIPNRLVSATNWTTLTFNNPFEPQAAFTGDGVVDESGAKGVLEHIVLCGAGGTGTYTTWLDDFQVVLQNYRTFSLDSGAPAGATIARRSGKFSWTPTTAQVGTWTITVRVTDNLGAQDFETITVTVTGTGNNAPVLAAIGNKTVKELTPLTFTATATDADAGQTLSYSLDVGAPAGATIGASTGAFSWTPTEAQGPGNYPITVRVTDNGSPTSNDFEAITVTVSEANSAPVLAAITDRTINEGQTLSLTATATDSDVPANTITYSLANAPAGMTINSSSGAISWPTAELDGADVVQVTVNATDNGSPALTASRSFNVTVNEVNIAPVLTLGTSTSTQTGIADFENVDAGVYNGRLLFRVPNYSGTTSSFIDTAPNATSVETNYPDFDGNTSEHAMLVSWSFKTGTSNPWLRLTTFAPSSTNIAGEYDIANPTIDFGAHVRFKVWTDRALKVGLGVRETGTGAAIGANGGFSGTMEWLGVTSVVSGQPQPTRTVTASNWTTLDFNLPAEPITAFTGDGILASGKGVFECLALVPVSGVGVYNIYFDDLEVVKGSTNLNVDAGQTITITNTASDADRDPSGIGQLLTFSLGASAPTNAVIDPDTGVFTWTPLPEQSPSTNIIPVIVTDNGSPALSDTKNLTITVNKVNTRPELHDLPDKPIEIQNSQTVTFTATATDGDIPAQTLTFSLVGTPPAAATINAATGVFTWTAPASGYSTNIVTVRVSDNGVPPLYDELNVVIKVVPPNAAPSLNLGIARVTEPVVSFETFTNNTPNEYVMFKKPANSSTTSSYIDTSVTNYTSVTTSFPAGHSSAKVLKAVWNFRTGTANYWVRLTTFNTTALPNPAINASARLKFDVYTSKALKVGLGIRETGTTAANGANGGTTGTVEYVGVSSVLSGTPQPTRTVPASTWTTLEFDLPNEPIQAFTGDGILSPGQQALEHLALVGAGGTGNYTVYFDNFQVVTTFDLTPTLTPVTVSMLTGSTINFTASATDPDPGSGLTFSLDPGYPAGASINAASGAFTWTPSSATTNNVIVTVKDSPTNGGIQKSDSQPFIVEVKSDSLAPQNSGTAAFVAGGDSVTLTWDSTPGAVYKLQLKVKGGDAWTDVQTVTATGSTASVVFTNTGTDASVRIVESGDASNE